ncbi:hypothetical protein H696_03969 [Fonticula alba]|uniref:Vacuole membrane protein 1 n=1 Tax=Fonticula alba TaxID=691883 RepID=A0A058Z6L2_FONAL|nr:hypothetical protein H696_03969 [Fonticula alba]KCV69548.1 hypothetical protein H696_03969 [Fonticula alba]|eukprot:XP_009496113.1 hypothetical protein H696_03969 [Fonticula alba]
MPRPPTDRPPDAVTASAAVASAAAPAAPSTASSPATPPSEAPLERPMTLEEPVTLLRHRGAPTPPSSTLSSSSSRSAPPPPSSHLPPPLVVDLRAQHQAELASLSLLRRPLFTLGLAGRLVAIRCRKLSTSASRRRRTVLALLVAGLAVLCTPLIEGSHQHAISLLRHLLVWYGGWIVLGFMSSAGMGFGAHTFLLYLGPYIVSTILEVESAECAGATVIIKKNALLREWSYSCDPTLPRSVDVPSLLSIFQFFLPEAIFWGIGTAIGELLPYFFARAAARSGQELDLTEFGVSLDAATGKLTNAPRSPAATDSNEGSPRLRPEASPAAAGHPVTGTSTLTTDPVAPAPPAPLSSRLTILVAQMMKRWGFFGIMLMASIPNPLFDLAGLLSGYLEMPFWEFFGATLIGKAGVKVLIQCSFTALAISRQGYLLAVLQWLERRLPFLHEGSLTQWEKKFRSAAHFRSSASLGRKSWIARSVDILVFGFLLMFAASAIVNMAAVQLRSEHAEQQRQAGLASPPAVRATKAR